MSGINALWKAAKRTGIVLLVLGVGLFTASCGKDGSVYGAVTWDYYLYYASLGGFPSSGSANIYYKVSPGTYNVYYTLDDGTYYSPGWYVGYPYDPSYYWQSTYTVEADKGSVPFINGEDLYFELYLSWSGLYKYGDVRYIGTPSQPPKSMEPKPGTQSWTENGLRITVTNTIVRLSPEDLSKIEKTHMEK
jgi:hypothetical protein